MMCWIWNKRN